MQDKSVFGAEDVELLQDLLPTHDEIYSDLTIFARPIAPVKLLRYVLGLSDIDPVDSDWYVEVEERAKETNSSDLNTMYGLLQSQVRTLIETMLREHLGRNKASYVAGAQRSTKQEIDLQDRRAPTSSPGVKFAFGPHDEPSKARSITNSVASSAPQDSRVEMNPTAGHPQHSPTRHTSSDNATEFSGDIVQDKKGATVESYFRDSKLTGAPDQSLSTLLRDYDIVCSQKNLDGRLRSMFFDNALGGDARDFFCDHASHQMSFSQIAAMMNKKYNSQARQLHAQAIVDGLDISTFTQQNEIHYEAVGLQKLIERIDKLAPQLPTGFGDPPHKMRYLRKSVMNMSWARTPISHMTTAAYDYTQFIAALHESLQITRELPRSNLNDTLYGQYLYDPMDVRKRDNARSAHEQHSFRRSRWRNSYRSPKKLSNRDNSRSPARPRRYDDRPYHQNDESHWSGDHSRSPYSSGRFTRPFARSAESRDRSPITGFSLDTHK